VPLDRRGSFAVQRQRVLEDSKPAVVLDVGANTGHFASTLRASGYGGRIVSFEPLPAPFAELARRSARDPAWECRRLALGDVDGSIDINVAANLCSSSALAMTELHLSGAPESRYIARERVPIARLDTVADELLPPGATAYLKLDIQGFELHALRGAERTLLHVEAIECELSLAPLYDGQPLFPAVVAWLDERGFDLIALERAFSHPVTGRLLQLDGLFVRRR
jgi:FkbM family methyltransferase